MDKIYNKNAREKALLEEAYGSVYNEGVNYGDTSGGAARRASAHRKQLQKAGAVRLELRGPEGTSRATLPKGDPKIEELEAQGYTRVSIEDEQNPNAGEYDAQGEENLFAVTANPNDEEEEYTAEQHAKGIKMAIEALGFIEAELPTDYEENINVNDLKLSIDHLSRALHHLLDETDVDVIMGRVAEQEYDMQRDPLGRTEADPRQS
jgi:hypothetical protein